MITTVYSLMKNVEKFSAADRCQNKMDGIMPYPCVYIDAGWKDFMFAASQCFRCHSSTEIQNIEDSLRAFWTNPVNQNAVLSCLSVRSGLDLYLKVMSFPPGSEVIMSAINIPDMIRVVEHHKLKVVPWDISIETVQPKMNILPSLITDKTVAIIVAHIYGKWCDLEPIITAAKMYNLKVIEDCAESFCGFDRLGHPDTDLALFSFGIIKFYTAFGGAIAKVKDEAVLNKMLGVYRIYATQTHRTYLLKILKYFLVYFFLNVPSINKTAVFFTRTFNLDHKKLFVKMLRGFPDQMLQKIKSKPSPALLAVMKKRLEGFIQSDFNKAQVKGEYVRMRLPDDWLVGMEASVNNYWLFPILVENPDTVVKLLYAMGIDAYRGATQLNLIEPDQTTSLGVISPLDPRYPSEARYLIDHVVYIPVQENVPFHELNRLCTSVIMAVKSCKDGPKVRIQSKL